MGQFAHFDRVRHLITGRASLATDMNWTGYDLIEDTERTGAHMVDVTRKMRSFLKEDYAGVDPQIGEVLSVLDQKSAAEDWHKHGTFKDHLTGVYRMLSLWEQPKDVCLCGLLHSVYSNEYVDLALFEASKGRDVLKQLVGPETENLIFTFCTMARTQFTIDLLEAEEPLRGGMTLCKSAGAPVVHLTPEQVGKFLVVTLADLGEQLFGWQDEVMAGYPYLQRLSAAEHWSAALWPGPLRPSGWMPSLLSRLARHVPHLPVKAPPIFENCTAVVSDADSSAATALYWQVAMQSGPLVSMQRARGVLEKALAHNPWMPEPYLLLAQIGLLGGDFDMARRNAARGLQLLGDWGTSWDKRVSWSGWVAWARILLQRASAEDWPKTLTEHNNLGLVVTPHQEAAE
jgi:hypothetical protein